MGPISLFDKSFLQSLKLDESVWFDHFFLTNVCPLFYVETLADLEKTGKRGRTSLDEVRIIAEKFPQMNSGPCAYHRDLCISSLLGKEVPMTGQIPLDQAKIVSHEGQLHAIAEESRVVDAFSRWQEGRFLEVERLFAKGWRQALSGLNLEGIAAMYRAFGIDPKSCKSLEQAKSVAQAIVSGNVSPESGMAFAFSMLSIPIKVQSHILLRWQSEGFPTLKQFAPYSAFVLTIEIFFDIALATGLISTERPSNRVDIGYLFYLPFCMIFISSDRLHRQTAPLFLRENQEFVWGRDLKSALGQINLHFSALPDGEKEKPIYTFAGTPPHGAGALVEELWDRHIPRWRESESASDLEKRRHFKTTLGTVREIERARSIESDSFAAPSVESVIMKRRVHRKKGSWYQGPKNRPED